MSNTQRFWETDRGPAMRMAGQHRSWLDEYDEEDGDEEPSDEFLDEDE